MNSLSFSGEMLLNGFSVYLFRINNSNENYYYVGMTGDNHYPSARSAVHRFSGHFELQPRSTQNQLGRQLARKGDAWVASATIEMFHWPLDGFSAWEKSLRNFSKETLNAEDKRRYATYKKRQRQVRELEEFVIHQLSMHFGDQLWNKAISRSSECPEGLRMLANEIIQTAKRI